MRVWVGPLVGGIGVVLLAAVAILGWIVIPNIIDNQIIEEVQLVNNSETWDKWKELPVPIYLNFYTFDITNPDEVESGAALPVFKEKGPYSFREQRVKINLSQETDDVVKYEQITTYWFDKDESCADCSPDDVVTIINVAYMSVAMVMYDLDVNLAKLLSRSVFGNEPYIKRNVRVGDLLFDGFDASLYTTSLGPLLPEEFSGGRFGLYKGMNISADGVYEIYTGVGKTSDFGKVKTWEGSPNTPEGWWRPNTPCSMINGTDGSLHPPFVEKDWTMYIWSTDLCRSLYLNYEKEMEHLGIKGYRFTAPKWMLEDPRVNEDNQCFCWEDHIENCTKGGVIPIKGCKGGAPIIMSTPHFLDGAEEYQRDSGLTPPDRASHETIIDVEPHTGLTLRANKRIQVNVEVKKIPGIPQLENVFKEHYIFPLLWADEAATLDQENADDLKSKLLTPLKIINISKWTLLGVSLLVVGAGVAIFMVYRRRSKRTV